MELGQINHALRSSYQSLTSGHGCFCTVPCLEQRGFEADGGLKGTANKQNPVGPNNQNRQKYLDAADKHQKSKVKASCS